MALSREEKIRLLQGGELAAAAPAGGGLTREQKIALLQGGAPDSEPHATPNRLREDVSFAGSDGAGKTASGLFPRTAQAAAEGQGYGKQVLSAGNDLLSLPGRALASLGKDKGESTLNSMADTEGSTFAGKVLRDPGTGAALLAAPAAGLAGAATAGRLGLGLGGRLLGGAAAGATEGAASAAAHQAENVREGRGMSLGQAALEVGTSAALPGAMTAAGKVAKGASGFVNKQLGRLAQELSGVSEEALRTYGSGFGKGAKELAAAAGKQHEIGQKLVTMLDDLDNYLPEKQVVDQALQQMPAVNVANTIQRLQGAKTGGALSSSRATNAKIDELISDLTGAADPQGNVPAATFRGIRREIDDLVGDAFGKESNKYVTALKEARHQMADDLATTAEASGRPEYAEAMRSMAQKLRKADDLKSFLGKSAQTREQRAESFVANLFGKNKAERQKAVAAMGEIFGEDFLEQSRLAHLAAELGEEGKAGLLSRQFTGRSLLGPAAAGAAYGLSGGDEAKALPFLLMASPRIAAGTLSGATRTSQAAGYLGKKLAAPARNVTRSTLFRGEDEK